MSNSRRNPRYAIGSGEAVEGKVATVAMNGDDVEDTRTFRWTTSDCCGGCDCPNVLVFGVGVDASGHTDRVVGGMGYY